MYNRTEYENGFTRLNITVAENITSDEFNLEYGVYYNDTNDISSYITLNDWEYDYTENFTINTSLYNVISPKYIYPNDITADQLFIEELLETYIYLMSGGMFQSMTEYYIAMAEMGGITLTEDDMVENITLLSTNYTGSLDYVLIVDVDNDDPSMHVYFIFNVNIDLEFNPHGKLVSNEIFMSMERNITSLDGTVIYDYLLNEQTMIDELIYDSNPYVAPIEDIIEEETFFNQFEIWQWFLIIAGIVGGIVVIGVFINAGRKCIGLENQGSFLCKSKYITDSQMNDIEKK
jgi:hypothetical protein